MSLAPKTARPIVKFDGDDALDISCAQKRKAHAMWFNNRRKEAEKLKLFSDISNDKNKLAVIHADGNGLGVLVKNLVEVVKKSGDTGVIANFSEALAEAT